MLLLPCFADSQVVQTGLADPIVDINFGNGEPEVGNPIANGHSDYTFSSDECPRQGFYSIIRNNNLCTNGLPSRGFNVIRRDHTFKINNSAFKGYLMVVNGSGQPDYSIYFADTVKNLCPNNKYLFTAAIATVGACGANLELPVAVYRVETLGGQVLVENAGMQYFETISSIGTYFDLPAGETSVILKLTSSKSAGGCGTKISIDDVQLRIAGPSVTSALQAGTGWVGNLCAADHPSVNLVSNIGTSFINPLMQWQTSNDGGMNWADIPNATSPNYTATFSTPDTFLYRIRAGESNIFSQRFCNVVSNWVKVNIDGPPTVEIISNSPVCSGSPIKLRVENFASAIWTGPHGYSQTGSYPSIYSAHLSDSGTYYAQATTLGGCTGNANTYVVMKGRDVYVYGDTTVCNGVTVPLNATGAVSYLWSPEDGLSNPKVSNPLAKPGATTIYQLKSIDADACVHNDQVVVKLKNKIELKAAIVAPEFICRPVDTVSLVNISQGNITNYRWNLGNGILSDLANPPTQIYHSVNDVRAYQIKLFISDSTGCADSITQVLKVASSCYIAVPSAFTPNGDGKNDFLYPANAYKATNLLFRVFNRYGQLVFQTKDWTQKWDGRFKGALQPTGAFIWILSYTDQGNNHVYLKGSTMLIR